MSRLGPDFREKARAVFTDHIGITLQDIRDKVTIGPASTPRRDTLSALDAIPHLFKLPLSSIPASWHSVRSVFESKNAAQLGVSAKRSANIKSAVIGSMKIHGVQAASLTS